ncbi:hypothetical protein Tco_0356092 [Tanacetum coccineum]
MESSNSNSKERELQRRTDSLYKGNHLHDIGYNLKEEESSLVNANDLLAQDLEDFTRCEPSAYRRELLENLDTLEAVIHKAVITYGRLQLLSQDVQINPVQAVDDRLIVSKSSGIESENNNALSKSVNETQLQQHESLVTESTTVEANLTTDVKALVDGSDIRPVNDQVPFAEVQLTAQHNVLANEQQHTEQSEPNYDTYLLEKGDSNTTSDSTNMCHRGGEIDQDAEHDQVKSPLLKAEFLKTNDMVEKEVYNELLNRFLQLEKHCISLEISIQQKEESFQSNKPCKNQDSPEFREFFEINELKAQLQAKNSTINNLKEQIKNVHEKSNEAKVLSNKCRSSRNSNLMTCFIKMMFGSKQFKPRSSSNDVWTKQFKPRSSSNDVWTKQFKPRSSSNDVWTKQFKPRSSSNDVWTKQFRPRSSS